MVHFLRLSGQQLGPRWVKEAATIFADDIHLAYHFSIEVELHAILSSFGIMLSLLETRGLTVNESKSKALIMWTGSQVRRIKSRLLTHRGSQLCLIIPKPNGEQYLMPVVKSTIYLGIILTYGNGAVDTMNTRIRAARLPKAQEVACRS